MIPAMRAVPRTSPFSMPSASISDRVSGRMSTAALAVATRSVSGLEPTSTICAAPDASMCVRPAGGDLPTASDLAILSASSFMGSPACPLTHTQDTRRLAASESRRAHRSLLALRFQFLVMVLTTYWLSQWTRTSSPAGAAASPSTTASISMRLLVVFASRPLTTRLASPRTMIAAHPPGPPGLSMQAPSV